MDETDTAKILERLGSGEGMPIEAIRAAEAEFQPVMPPDDPFDADEFESFDDDAPIGDYDPFVEPDADAWCAAGERSRIDAIRRYHRREGFEADRLDAHAVVHGIVENQIALGDELPVRRTLQRLMAEGLDRHDAIHVMGSILVGHINELARKAQQEEEAADSNAAYFSELERLTARSWRRSG